MWTLDEWLTQAGFRQGNPFALKEADRADAVIQVFFVRHPAYNEILDGPEGTPCASSVLHAPRGAGKSTSRQMFEGYCAAYRPRSLIVHLTDWMPIAEQFYDSRFAFAGPHLEQIICQTVEALARRLYEPWLHDPLEPTQRALLGWMCAFSEPSLELALRGGLRARGWLAADPPQVDMRRLPIRTQLEQLVAMARAIGYHDLYILVDNLDELPLTTSDVDAGVKLLSPLLSNLRLNEVRNLAFKYFIPSEIFYDFQQRHALRADRITCAELRWDRHDGDALLLDLLHRRLAFFSDGLHVSLAASATPDLRDIDDQLIHAARGNPRLLLNLGDWTIRACASHANDGNWYIQAKDVAAALAQALRWVETTGVLDRGSAPQSAPMAAATAAEAAEPPGLIGEAVLSASGVPLFRIRNGVLWRGTEELAGWHNFRPLQRALLQYLYERRGKVCYKEDILRDVWAAKGFVPSDDSLRKLAERVTLLIEPDPEQPLYIEKVSGGHYRLNNAAD